MTLCAALVRHAWDRPGLPNANSFKAFWERLLGKAHNMGLARVARPPRPSRAWPGRCCRRDRIHTNASQVRLTRVHGAGQGRSPTSAESGVAWTLLREEPPGGQAMDLPRGEWRTAILAGDAGTLSCPNPNSKFSHSEPEPKCGRSRLAGRPWTCRAASGAPPSSPARLVRSSAPSGCSFRRFRVWP